MRLLFVAVTLPIAGCSLIYNPRDLPGPDAAKMDARFDAPDIVLDADPSALALELVEPALIFEGTGTGGGRKAVIAVHGTQIVQGAKITITAHDGTTNPMIVVDDASTTVADNGFIVAAPITIAVNPGLTAAMGKLRLDVTVTQPSPAGDVVQTLSALAGDAPALELQGLDELAGAPAPLASGEHEYSEVSTTAGLTAADTTSPLVIRAHGGVTIAGTSRVSANGQTPGPGAAGGGAGGGTLAEGKIGFGDGAGKPSGGGGGYGTTGAASSQTANSGGPMAGVPSLPVLAAPNRGSGGAGGRGGAIVVDGSGGAGGGGGGTIEITAGGAIMVGTVEAKGGNGENAVNDGGGGSGGTILLRSGAGAITATALGVAGGTGPSGGNGGNGGVGRIRIDSPVQAAPVTDPTAYRGPMFSKDTPLITRDPEPMLTVFGQANTSFQYFFLDAGGNLRGPFSVTVGPNGSNNFQIAAPLFRGNNRLCTLVDGADFATRKPEAFNCIDLVYLFQVP